MNKSEKRFFSLTSSIVFITGTIYFVVKYFFKIETDFGVRPHSLTSPLLHLHIVLVPFLVAAFGYFLKLHVLPMLKGKKSQRKKSGIFILSTLIIMVFSGYLLQIGLDPYINSILGWVHIIISFMWIIMYLRHSRLKL